MTDPVLWGIHARAECDSLFLNDGYVAIGWHELGDPRAFGDREKLKAGLQEALRDEKAGAVRGWAGIIWRFINVIKIGDFVVHRSRTDKQVHLGRIDGEYEYAPQRAEHHPNQRRTTWLKTVPPTAFTPGGLREIGSRPTLFRVRNYADEFLAALRGSPPPSLPLS